MIVLGIDPGLAALGWGVLSAEGARFRYVAHGCVRTARGELGASADTATRTREVLQAVETFIETHQPGVLAIEEFRYYGFAPTSMLQLGQVVGGLVELCRARKLELRQYPARTVKRSVAGSANAGKAQVQQIVTRLLGCETVRPQHAADALAVAMTAAMELRCEAPRQGWAWLRGAGR